MVDFLRGIDILLEMRNHWLNWATILVCSNHWRLRSSGYFPLSFPVGADFLFVMLLTIFHSCTELLVLEASSTSSSWALRYSLSRRLYSSFSLCLETCVFFRHTRLFGLVWTFKLNHLFPGFHYFRIVGISLPFRFLQNQLLNTIFGT